MTTRARRKVEPEIAEESNLDGIELSSLFEETSGGTYSEEPSGNTDPQIQSAPTVPEETQPNVKAKNVGPRHSTESFFTLAYGTAGAWLVHSGADIPVGRVLGFQAPIAGSRIDQIVAGTWIDKLLQPIVRYQETAEGLGALILLPLMIGAYERKPEVGAFPIFEKILRGAVESSLLEMAPLLKKQAADTKNAARTVADIQGLGADLGLSPEEMKDPIGAIIGGFFYMPEPEETGENG